MGRVTLKSEPEVYCLSATQTEKYNKKYPHLAETFLVQKHLLHPMFIYLDIFLSISQMMVEEPSYRVGSINVVNTFRETVNKSVHIA